MQWLTIPMKNKIILTGALAKKFAPEIPFGGRTVKDAIQCIGANYPSFRAYLIEAHENGIGFHIEIGGQTIESEADTLLNLVDGDILITAIPAGSKSGGGKVLTAVAIAALLIWALPASATAIGGTGFASFLGGNLAVDGSLTLLGQTLAGISVNLALTGMQQLLAPDPATDLQQDEGYLFNGAEQSIVQGSPIPILYGELAVPGHPISFELLPGDYQVNSVNNRVSYNGDFNAFPSQSFAYSPEREDGEGYDVQSAQGTTDGLRYGKSQTAVFTDVIAEGPIHGLVCGGNSILLNGDPAQTVAQSACYSNKGPNAVISGNRITLPNAHRLDPESSENHIIVRGVHNFNNFSSVSVTRNARGGSAVQIILRAPLNTATFNQLRKYDFSLSASGRSSSDEYHVARLVNSENGEIIGEGYLEVQSVTVLRLYPRVTVDPQLRTPPENMELVIDRITKIDSRISDTVLQSADINTIPDGNYPVDIYGPRFPNANTVDSLNDSAKYPNFSFEFRNGHQVQEPFKNAGGAGLGNTSLGPGSAFSSTELSKFKDGTGTTSASFNLTSNTGFGVRSDLVNSVAEVQITFQYPSLWNRNNESGEQLTGTVIHDIYINNKLFKPVTHIANTSSVAIFQERLRIDAELYQNLSDITIRIVRRSNNDIAYNEGTLTFPEEGYSTSSQCFISNLGTTLKENLYYPFTALGKVQVNSKNFQSVPTRAYHCKGALIQVPSNYRTRDETGGNAQYNGPWDGTLRSDRVYCNNPAWVLWDLITHKRYGLGDWITEEDLNIYSFYRVARYCDELVPDGKGGMEPRFTCNIYLRTTTEAYKVIKDLSTVFTGILYWINGEISPILDSREYPVYLFNSSNIIDGTINYETVGTRTRANQIIVSWNNPENNFKIEPLIVEDSEEIIKTGQIVTEEAVAFGATSYGQALRYGRWKLWTARNQTEIVSFKTAINAAFLSPGDIIEVPKYNDTTFNGRIIDVASGRVRIDKYQQLIDAGYDISNLACSLVLTEGVAKSVENENFTHTDNSVIEPGDTVPGVNSEIAAFNYTDNSGNTRALQWLPNTYVGTLTNGRVINGEEGWFDIEDAHPGIIGATWITNSISNSPLTNKEYKILGIIENSSNDYTVTGVEYFREKYESIDNEFVLNVADPVYDIPPPTTEVPAPENVYVVVGDLNSGQLLNDVTLYFDPPENSDGSLYQHVGHYEIEHSLSNLPNPVIVSKNSKTVTGMDILPGTHTIGLRTVNSYGNRSVLTKTTFVIEDPANQAVPRVLGVPLGGIISSKPLITGAGNFELENSSWAFSPIGNPRLVNTYTSGGMQNCANLVSKNYNGFNDLEKTHNSGYIFYDASDTADPFKLVLYNNDETLGLQYLYHSATGSEDRSMAFEEINSAISIPANSVVVTGTNLTDNWNVGDTILLPNDRWAKIAYIVDDTDMRIDRSFTTQINDSTPGKLNFQFDKNDDCVFAQVRNNNGTFEYYPINLTINEDLARTQLAVFRAAPAIIQFRNSTLVTSYSNIVLTVDAIGFTEPEFRITGSGFSNDDISQVAETIFSPATSGTRYVKTLDKVDSDFDSNLDFTVEVRETSDTSKFVTESVEIIVVDILDGTAGTPGIQGIQGIAGADGADGEGVEYIFTSTSTDSLPSSNYPLNSWGYDSPGTVNGQVWTDGAPSLTEDNPYLWRSQRKLIGQPAVGDAVAANWSTPTIVGKYGVDGTLGVSAPRNTGNYVYYLGTGIPTATPAATGYDFATGALSGLTENWSQSPPVIGPGNYTRVYYSSFIVIETDYDADTDSYDSVSITFSTPSLGHNFQGLVTFQSNDGFLYQDGAKITTIDGGIIKTGTVTLDRVQSNTSSVFGRTSTGIDQFVINAGVNFGIEYMGTTYCLTGYFETQTDDCVALGAYCGGSGEVAVYGHADVGIAGVFGWGGSGTDYGVELASGSDAIKINTTAGTVFTLTRTGAMTISGNITASGDMSLSGTLTGATVGISSDISQKENIKELTGALELLDRISGYSYEKLGNPETGIIAQEVEKVLPDSVYIVNGIKYVNYNAVIALLVQAVKELKNGSPS